MLLLDLFDEAGEQELHLFLKCEHFRDLCVGVLADNVLQLAPQHLLTLVMEERTFALRAQSMLADEGWLAALGVDADHVALVAVDALWAVLEGLVHQIKKYIILLR